MKRVLEPELMTDEEQVAAYTQADFSDSNKLFVNQIIQEQSNQLNKIIDLGCGPADIDILLAKVIPTAHITGVDASNTMIKSAKAKVIKENLSEQITFLKGRIPHIQLEGNFDLVISKDFLHHLPDPKVFWETIKKLAGAETSAYVMDLIRPATVQEAKRIVDSIAGKEKEVLKQDFYNSLLAGFTVDEIKEQLSEAELNLNITVQSRHFIVNGTI